MEGISLHTLIPLRSTNSDKAEMVSQLLLGETYDLIEQKENWCKIRLHRDNYLGWIADKLFYPNQRQKKSPCSIFPLPYAEAIQTSKNSLIRLVAGSILEDLDTTSGRFFINGLEYTFCDHYLYSLRSSLCGSPFEIASQWLGTPYLWGGKSCLGIDCSGLTQTVFSILGIPLARDAKDQALQGTEIRSLSEAQEGDLAFFTKENATDIIHVGILSASGTILHASGDVHIDMVDSTGIFSQRNHTYSHSLYSIRRYI